MDKKIIRIIDANSKTCDVELISILDNNGLKYIIYTKGEKKESGSVIIYISKLNIIDNKYILEDINDLEWKNIRKQLRKIINK